MVRLGAGASAILHLRGVRRVPRPHPARPVRRPHRLLPLYVLMLGLSGFGAAALASVATAAPAAAAEKRYAPEGIGTGGYDPVAYFTQGKAVQGSEQITAEHAGVTYRFASAEHRVLFQAAPETYLPRYGGFCAYAAAKGALAPTDPEAFTVLGGKLYLNYSAGVRERWLQRAGEYIRAADGNWPRLGAGAE